MKRIIILLAVFIISQNYVTAKMHSNDSALIKAELAYKQKQYEEAANIYQSVLDSGFHSLELYYNLGNSYFKLRNYSRAILNYERALLLDPTDEEVRFNLAKSKTFITDKIEAIPEFFIKSWFKNTIVLLNSDTWAVLALISFCLVIVGFLVFFFTRKVTIKKFVFILSVILFISFIITGFFSFKSKNYIMHSVSAIVMTPTVTVKSSPDNEGIDVFIIHSGTKVEILRTLAGWNEIRIADGKQGWLKVSDIEKI